MTKLLELSKKYDFETTNKSPIVPANISTEDIAWLIDSGYHLTFKLSPLSYIWCERGLTQFKKHAFRNDLF